MIDARRLEIARRSPLLRGVDEDFAHLLARHSTLMAHDRGSTIFVQGEDARAVHIVLDGWVKLYRMTPSGAEAVVGVFTRGSSFGEAVALRGEPYPVSAEAVTRCELMSIPSQVIRREILDNPEFCLTILAATFQHLHDHVTQIEQLKAHTGPQRLAAFLLDLADADGEGDSHSVTLPYDKSLIAGRLGMKPESLSRAFAKLRKFGVVVQRSQARITDPDALRAFADSDPADSWHGGGG